MYGLTGRVDATVMAMTKLPEKNRNANSKNSIIIPEATYRKR